MALRTKGKLSESTPGIFKGVPDKYGVGKVIFRSSGKTRVTDLVWTDKTGRRALRQLLADAILEFNEWLEKIEKPSEIVVEENPKPTFQEATEKSMTGYKDAKRSSGHISTIAGYHRRFIRYWGADTLITELLDTKNPRTPAQFLEWVQTEFGKLRQNTLDRYMIELRHLFDVYKIKPPENIPIAWAKSQRRRAKTSVFWAKRLLPFCSARDRLIILVTLNTALRRSDSLKFTAEQIHWQPYCPECEFEVPKAQLCPTCHSDVLYHGAIIFGGTKQNAGPHDYCVPLWPETLQALNDFGIDRSSTGFVFVNERTNQPYGNIDSMIARSCRMSAVSKVSVVCDRKSDRHCHVCHGKIKRKSEHYLAEKLEGLRYPPRFCQKCFAGIEPCLKNPPVPVFRQNALRAAAAKLYRNRVGALTAQSALGWSSNTGVFESHYAPARTNLGAMVEGLGSNSMSPKDVVSRMLAIGEHLDSDDQSPMAKHARMILQQMRGLVVNNSSHLREINAGF